MHSWFSFVLFRTLEYISSITFNISTPLNIFFYYIIPVQRSSIFFIPFLCSCQSRSRYFTLFLTQCAFDSTTSLFYLFEILDSFSCGTFLNNYDIIRGKVMFEQQSPLDFFFSFLAQFCKLETTIINIDSWLSR